MEPSEVAAGLAALLLMAGAIEAGLRAYRINLGWHVSPTIPVSELPPGSSVAFVPLARLAARERELADHLTALPDPVAADTWMRAATAARALRAHARRITAAEPLFGAGMNPDDGLALLVLRLREGVSAYERLTDTAAELATHVAQGSTPRNAELRLADATEALVGMIRGLPS
ncbi:MAG: hypothetical protein H0T99_03250 [Geodermatophilaceae bacterium]|nr:hypothetical protein [Geodermatophilaceae bacterium]